MHVCVVPTCGQLSGIKQALPGCPLGVLLWSPAAVCQVTCQVSGVTLGTVPEPLDAAVQTVSHFHQPALLVAFLKG